MALVFDTLAYMKTLETAGVTRDHAEAHANAVRDHVMRDLVTRTELKAELDRQTLRLTVRFGTMLAGATAILGALVTLR